TTDSKGAIYITDYQNLYSLSSSGNLNWKFEIIKAKQPSISTDGTLYIAGQEGIHGVLYALGSENEEVTTPSSPQNLEASSSDSEVSLSWDSPADNGGAEITEYKIYRGTDSDSLSELTTTANTEYTDNSVTNDQTYYYQVNAVNSEGEGNKSEIVSATPSSASENTTPSAPKNVETSSGDEQVELNWDTPLDNGGSEITEYKVYRKIENEDFNELTTVQSTSYTDNSVSNSETYYYQVSAVNSEGEGNKSEEVSATPSSQEENVPPSSPRQVNADGNEKEVILSWDASNDNGGSEITEYKVYRGEDGESLTELTTTSSTSYTDNSVSKDNTYLYKISAVNDIGEGDKSEEITASIKSEDDQHNNNNNNNDLPNTFIFLGVGIAVLAIVISIVLYKKS
ncbi:MAG: fibronectin type III domain-containing protein, partial [Thermoplasmatota archaeon]